ncbi:MAG: hypothetical protein IJO20_07235 [Ruminococcus sp.]|nr:hypothetical protein [Ruminococcus sp.]
MKTSYKVALGGVIGALSLVLMLLTSLIPFGTFAFPAFAGMLLICVVIELGYSWAFIVYTVVSALSLLFLTDKEAALYYVVFLGFYPIIKGLIEKLRKRTPQYIIKYFVFNVCMVLAFYLSIYIFSIPKESFNLFGVYLPWVFLLIGNAVFIVYDYCISKVVTVYLLKIHKLLGNKTKL